MAEIGGEHRQAAIPSGEGSVWADVSSLLDAACKDLRDGELIHGDNFNLFAAMSALEIMDPKMDSGVVSKYYSIDEAIEDGAAPVPISFDRTVDVRCNIDIMDHLLACEATWHKGHSLAQTVFSSIYLLRPERTSSHPMLHSYSTVIRSTCKELISVVSDARTHEEEDFFTMTYGLPLSGDGDEKCLSMLNAVEENISRQLRACKAAPSKRGILGDMEPLQDKPDLEEGFCKAVLSRLRFRKHFYHILMCMKRPQGRGLELARKHIASCISELQDIRKSTEFLRTYTCANHENVVECQTTASGCQPIGFDASLNIKLCAPTPPRSIKILSWKEAVEYFLKLLRDLDIICSYAMDSVLEGILRFVVHFQKSQPDLVARALLQRLLVQDGKLYGRDHMFAVICKTAALPEAFKNHDIQQNENIIQLGLLVINLLKILSTNSAWQRRKLGKVLQDWRVIYFQLELAFRQEFGDTTGNLQDENVKLKIVQHILLWVEEQTYWIASRFLILGFELELYSSDEYCMVYWYMYTVFMKLAEKTHYKTISSSGSVKRKGKKKRDSTKDMAKDPPVSPAVLFIQCHIYLAEGLTMMLAALGNENKLLQSPSAFNTEHEKFIQHFELLQKAGIPDHATYQSFKESKSYARFSTLPMYNYFKDAQKIAKEIKSSFSNDPDKLAEVRRIEQVAEHNSIAVNVICRLGMLDPSLKVTFEFSHHPYFATAVVKRS